jgi:CBS domain-containing protein
MRNLCDVVLNQRPVVLNGKATVIEACREMQSSGAGSVAVVDDDARLIGIFPGRDAVCRVLSVGREPARTSLAEAMTPNPITMSPDRTAVDALRLMWDGGFRHLPLVKDGRIVGVVSRGDFKGLEVDRHEAERDLWEHMR